MDNEKKFIGVQNGVRANFKAVQVPQRIGQMSKSHAPGFKLNDSRFDWKRASSKSLKILPVLHLVSFTPLSCIE